MLTKLVIFFSLTEAPLPDPTPTPPNGPEKDPKDPNGPKSSHLGWDGQAVAIVREKENHCAKSEVSKRGWREGVGDQQRPKYSKKMPPWCSPAYKGA